MLRDHPVSSAVASAAALADRVWRVPLLLAALLMVASGPTQALGRTGAVEYASLGAVALAAFAVPMGLLALLTKEAS